MSADDTDNRSNATVAAAPHPGAPEPLPKIVQFSLLGWLLPGLGHILIGRRRHGTILLLLVVGSFVGGFFLSNREAVSRELHPYAFWAQVGFGGGVLPLLYLDPAREVVLNAHESIGTFEPVPRHTDTGVLFCSIAGLLNLLILLDLVDRMLGGPVRKPTDPEEALA